jgi:hypothetical protein
MKIDTNGISKQDLVCCGNCMNFATDHDYDYCEIDEKPQSHDSVCML